MQVNDEKPCDEINITPMLDLAYVLLVIFILMTTATVTGMKASLPRACNNAPVNKESNPDFPVVIRGDSTTPYQSIVDALEVVSRLGIQQV